MTKKSFSNKKLQEDHRHGHQPQHRPVGGRGAVPRPQDFQEAGRRRTAGNKQTGNDIFLFLA